MDARRFRNDSAQRLAEFRWWGSVLLAMFALVQTAPGSGGFFSAAPSRADRPASTFPARIGTRAELALVSNAPRVAIEDPATLVRQ